jgi:hypothetical protein
MRIKTSLMIEHDVWLAIRHFALDLNKDASDVVNDALQAYLKAHGRVK